MIMTCLCQHKGQDELHGRGKRVGNPVNGHESDFLVLRCTVCGAERRTARRHHREKTGGGNGKTNYWTESAECTRRRFNKDRSFGMKVA